jgi:hypothetical protein
VRGKWGIPLTALPAELHEGMNRVVAPVDFLLTEIRSGWAEAWSFEPVAYSCSAEARASLKPSNSEAVRPSSRVRIWSSVSTVSVMVTVAVAVAI